MKSAILSILSIFIALLVLAGCAAPLPASPAPAAPIPTATRTAPPTPAPALPIAPAPAPPSAAAPGLMATRITPPSPTAPPPAPPAPPSNRTQYRLWASLDYAAHTLVVTQTLVYTNSTPENLPALPLVIEARRYPRTFTLRSVSDALDHPLPHYHWDGNTLWLSLPTDLAPGQSTRLRLAYSLALSDAARLPQLRPYPLGYTAQQANFGDWYPFVPPYAAGRGWLIHPPALYGETLVYDLADLDVSIRRPPGQERLTVAAPAPARRDGEWLRYHHSAARSFAWSVSPFYEVLTQTVDLPTGGPPVIVASYHFAPHAQAAQSLLTSTAAALQVYSRLFGPYPHPWLSAVQADFIDGMEYDGLYFLSTDFYNWHQPGPQDFLAALAAHETAHQWFGGLVGSDQALQPWLDEALCTYSEALYYEQTDPAALEWWWTYRVDYYDPQGWVDQAVYAAPQWAGQYRAYRDPVYLRGAIFMRELRAALGDPAFFAALGEYVRQNAYRQAAAADLLSSLRAHAAQDLDPLLAEYLQNP